MSARRAIAIGAGIVLAAGCGVKAVGGPRAKPAPADDGIVEVSLAPPGGAPPPPPEVDGAPPAAPPDASATDATVAPATGLLVGSFAVPKQKLLVVLHIGHSNMAGRATGPEELRPWFFEPHPRLFGYQYEDPIAAAGPLRFRPAVEPLAPDPYVPPGAGGPGMALLRATLALAPDAVVVSIGRGQSGRDIGYCQSFRKGGLLYDDFMVRALKLKGRATFVGLFTMFGTSEFDAPGRDPAALAECLKQIAADVRGDLDEPGLPLLVGDYEAGATGLYAPDEPGAMTVIAQLRMVPEQVARAALIPTDGLPMEDDHHYDLTGHKLWAERGLAIVKQRGWADWAAP